MEVLIYPDVTTCFSVMYQLVLCLINEIIVSFWYIGSSELRQIHGTCYKWRRYEHLMQDSVILLFISRDRVSPLDL